jgi:hypothetical protein
MNFMDKEKLIKKFLWLLFYAQKGSAMQIQVFYAQNERDAQVQMEQFVAGTALPIHEHYLQPALQGFIVHHVSLRGVIHERIDGSLLEGSWYD